MADNRNTDYLPRNAIEKFIESGLNNPDKDKVFGHDAIEILAEVHYMPAADVAPVVRGRWNPEKKKTLIPVELDDFGDPVMHEYVAYRCDRCGRSSTKQEPYCHCGAKMEQEDQDDSR